MAFATLDVEASLITYLINNERVDSGWLFFYCKIFINMKSNIKLTTLLKQALTEQVDMNRVNNAYAQTVTAVKGMGTDIPAVLNSIKMLRNRDEFLEYMLKFKDKKTGYTTFPEMINAEYDRFNLADVQKIVVALRNIGVSAEMGIKKDMFGNELFNKFTMSWLKMPTTKKDRYIRKKQWLDELPKAVAFWRAWLSDPITKQRVQQNWDAWLLSGKNQIKIVWPIYFNMLNKLYIKFYDATTGSGATDAYAYVEGKWNGNPAIYVNLEQNDPDKYDTLVHEIQHIIYNIKPLNPEKKITNAFVKKNTKRDTPSSIKSTVVSSASKKLNANTLKAKATITSLGLNMTPDQLLSWKQWATGTKPDDPEYVCRATEKMSNIMAVRNYFKLKPGQNITVAMLKPYIEEKKQHTDITWILGCWALNNFPDLNTMLNRINMLAKNNTPKGKTPNIA